MTVIRQYFVSDYHSYTYLYYQTATFSFRGMNMKIIKHVEHGYILINYLVYHYVSIMFVEVPP